MDPVVGIDQLRVGRWLDDNIRGANGPYEYRLIAGGRSNLTFTVDDANGGRFVLRRPPTGHVLATAHDMAREYRVIAAVGTTGFPVPLALGLCEDPEVNGSPFYVMSFVGGVVLDSIERGRLIPPDVRAAAGRDLIDVLGALHSVDIDAVGLGGLAKREDYVARQLKRWTAQWDQTRTDDLDVIERVGEYLRANVPAQQGATIVHGDYRFGNCLTDPVTGRINAVLDWELCTLGDPLADVGYLAVYWRDRGSASLAANDPNGAGGFGSYDELVGRYAERTGRDVTGLDYYEAFNCWRLAVISQGVYSRFLHGAMGDQAIDLASARRTVELLAVRAAETLGI